MFFIDADKTIHLTRGDTAAIVVSAQFDGGDVYMFAAGDLVRLSVFERKNAANVYLSKDVQAVEGETSVSITLSQEDTKIGSIINKPTDLWYEVVLNPETQPQTIIGYDDDGEKILRLYPEGGDGA